MPFELLDEELLEGLDEELDEPVDAEEDADGELDADPSEADRPEPPQAVTEATRTPAIVAPRTHRPVSTESCMR